MFLTRKPVFYKYRKPRQAEVGLPQKNLFSMMVSGPMTQNHGGICRKRSEEHAQRTLALPPAGSGHLTLQRGHLQGDMHSTCAPAQAQLVTLMTSFLLCNEEFLSWKQVVIWSKYVKSLEHLLAIKGPKGFRIPPRHSLHLLASI